MNYQRANYPTNDATELALAAIWAILNCDGVAGWNDWSTYAANGEWF